MADYRLFQYGRLLWPLQQFLTLPCLLIIEPKRWYRPISALRCCTLLYTLPISLSILFQSLAQAAGYWSFQILINVSVLRKQSATNCIERVGQWLFSLHRIQMTLCSLHRDGIACLQSIDAARLQLCLKHSQSRFILMPATSWLPVVHQCQRRSGSDSWKTF